MAATIETQTIDLTIDADLLLAARAGDRKAFSHIVERYQSMVTGLTYAACGNLHRSEDLAQETFLAAWKSLNSLRDPNKLPAWLCRIARHRLIDLSRKEAREELRIDRAQKEKIIVSDQPRDPLLVAEERELLWRTLSQIPQPYRDTMVLYYRQSQSTAAVAAAMEVSEDAVRQRLTRGREMLREHVAVLLEHNLTTSAPTPAFTQSVLSAIPITLPIATATTFKTTTAAKAGGILPLLLLWLSPIFAIAGLFISTVSAVRNAPSAAARKNSFINALLMWFFIIAIMAEQIFLALLELPSQKYIFAQSITWSVYGIIVTTAIYIINRQFPRRLESGLATPADAPPQRSLFVAISITLSATVGGLGWMFRPALQAGDTLAALLIGALAFFILPFITLKIAHTAQKRRRLNPLVAGQLSNFTLISSITLTICTFLHWRLHEWMAAISHSNLPTIQSQFPLWPIDLAALTLSLYTALLLLLAIRNRSTA